VSLVAILDADKQGFLRSARSLIQTIGRAARHINGKAILYGDKITDAMQQAISENERRREKQLAFNAEHGITPRGVQKRIKDIIDSVGGKEGTGKHRQATSKRKVAEEAAHYRFSSPAQLAKQLKMLENEMYELARNLEFERAAAIRDKIESIKATQFGLTGSPNG
jgi:excinuclease ABC subunit B